MTDHMVRTQVYLPQATYNALVERAKQQGLTMASQIRTALDEYLQRTQDDDEGVILQPDDPIFKMMGIFDSGLPDLGTNHDHYLYGTPKRDETDKLGIREKTVPPRKAPKRRASRSTKPPR